MKTETPNKDEKPMKDINQFTRIGTFCEKCRQVVCMCEPENKEDKNTSFKTVEQIYRKHWDACMGAEAIKQCMEEYAAQEVSKARAEYSEQGVMLPSDREILNARNAFIASFMASEGYAEIEENEDLLIEAFHEGVNFIKSFHSISAELIEELATEIRLKLGLFGAYSEKEIKEIFIKEFNLIRQLPSTNSVKGTESVANAKDEFEILKEIEKIRGNTYQGHEKQFIISYFKNIKKADISLSKGTNN